MSAADETKPSLARHSINRVILIVDDTPHNLNVAKTVLKFHGATVYTATNGAEALDVLQYITPDAILLDIRMPTMNGWEMYRIVRADPRIAHLPIIAVTAYAAAGDREEILGAGFDGYITKPFDVTRFVNEIEQILLRAAQQSSRAG